MVIKGAIFDMDGTLLDSMYVWKSFGKEYLRRKGIFTKDDMRDKLAPMTLKQAAEMFRSDFGITDSVAQIESDVNKIVEDEYFYKIMPKEGVVELLDAFSAAGIRMCVATLTDRYLVEAVFKRTGLLGYFEKIFTCSELGISKNDPAVFEMAREALGTPKEHTVVFEDSRYAMKTAKGSGFPVVAVKDEYTHYCEAEIRELADVYLETVTEWKKKLVIE